LDACAASTNRLLGLGFALDQLRHRLGDLIEVAREISSPPKGLVAANYRMEVYDLFWI
jgi:hypothetical protein